MNEFLAIDCPYCGEQFQISVEPSDGDARLVVDCEVCCRPMTVSIRVRGTEIADVQVTTS